MYKTYEYGILEKKESFLTETNLNWIKQRLPFSSFSELDNELIYFAMKTTIDEYKNRFLVNKDDIVRDQLQKALTKANTILWKRRSESLETIQSRYKNQQIKNKDILMNRRMTTQISSKRGKRISHMNMDW